MVENLLHLCYNIDMSCPYFEIQKTEDLENIAEIINADKEPKHFIRQRRFTPFDLRDDDIKSAFNDKIHCSQSGYFNALRFFSIVFPIMIAVSIYVMFAATPENRTGLIAIPITALFIGIIWAIFLTCFTIEFAFIKSCDDLFILYDKASNPYCIEIRKKRIRVLYDGALYIIKGKKIKATRKERKLYYAYLNMFPQSVLDMGKYVDNSDKTWNPVLIPYANYLQNGNCTLSFRASVPTQTPNSTNSDECGKTYITYPTLRSLRVWRQLHFCKFIFTVNNELKLSSVYSAARENAIISYHALTLSTVTESGETAIGTLKQIALKNSLLGAILKEIYNSF